MSTVLLKATGYKTLTSSKPRAVHRWSENGRSPRSRSECSSSQHQAVRSSSNATDRLCRATSGVMVGGEKSRPTTQSENRKGPPAPQRPNQQRASLILTVDRGQAQTSSTTLHTNRPVWLLVWPVPLRRPRWPDSCRAMDPRAVGAGAGSAQKIWSAQKLVGGTELG